MKRFLALPFVLILVGLGSSQQPPNSNSNLPYFELRRDDRPITVQQTATDAQGGIAITRGGSECRKDENISFFYAPEPREVETRVNNTVIRSNAVIRSQPKEGGAEAQDKAILDFFAGSLEYNEETACPQNVKRDKNARVTVVEGRTTVNGSSLLYTNADGEGKMGGPIDLERRAEGDSPALSASARTMDFNIDNDITTLRGEVQVESDGRTSRAEVLELDEEAGFALLRGNPATSRNEEGEVRGRVIEYDLESNDVVVSGGVQGTFDIELGEEENLPQLGGADSADEETDDPEGSDIPDEAEDGAF